jgi:hypothetical protein
MTNMILPDQEWTMLDDEMKQPLPDAPVASQAELVPEEIVLDVAEDVLPPLEAEFADKKEEISMVFEPEMLIYDAVYQLKSEVHRLNRAQALMVQQIAAVTAAIIDHLPVYNRLVAMLDNPSPWLATYDGKLYLAKSYFVRLQVLLNELWYPWNIMFTPLTYQQYYTLIALVNSLLEKPDFTACHYQPFVSCNSVMTTRIHNNQIVIVCDGHYEAEPLLTKLKDMFSNNYQNQDNQRDRNSIEAPLPPPGL